MTFNSELVKFLFLFSEKDSPSNLLNSSISQVWVPIRMFFLSFEIHTDRTGGVVPKIEKNCFVRLSISIKKWYLCTIDLRYVLANEVSNDNIFLPYLVTNVFDRYMMHRNWSLVNNHGCTYIHVHMYGSIQTAQSDAH